MKEKKKNLLAALQRQPTDKIPVWLMRQAGRYLPEYRELRKKAGSFMNLALNPERAAEATLQPVKRFGTDGAILFSDILMVPYGLGYGLEFEEGRGPVLEKIRDKIPVFSADGFFSLTRNIFEAVRLVSETMPSSTTLIGFCGGPFTVACYMLGESADGFERALEFSRDHPAAFESLLSVLVEASGFYLRKQIEAGAETVQIFDSWASLAPPEHYGKFVIEPTKGIIEEIRKAYPGFPVTGFPRNSRPENLYQYARETGITGLSLNTGFDLFLAQENIAAVLQGNLDPLRMEGEETPMLDAAEAIISAMKRPFVFNLGHGLTPRARPENVAALVEFVHNASPPVV